MVKVITFIKRKAGMPVDEFQRYWRTRHPHVVTRLPGVRRYVQSHTLPSAYGAAEPPYDGIAEVWADGTDALRAMTRSPDYAAVEADEARFIDRATMGFIVTEEHLLEDGPVTADAVKHVEFLTRRPGLTVEAFQLHWRDRHAPLVARLPGVRRYWQSPTRPSAYGGNRAPAYDGVASTWFDSAEAIRAAAAGPGHERVAADRAQFLAPAPAPAIVTREHMIAG
jgi:uncharacterized protein (TIGR02118 family)